MYNIVLTNYGNTQISNKVVLDGVILLADYISNISTVTSVTGYSVKLDIPARGNVKDKIGNILIRDDSSNTYIAKTILFYKNVNSEKKIIAGFSQNTAIINKLNKSINLFLSFDFSVFTNGFQFALVQAGFSQASQNVDGLVHIEDPNVEFDDSYSVYSKVQIDNKLSSYAQTSAIPTKTSQLDNDSNFINQHQSIKTINNQSLVGTGNIAISQGEYNKINTISVNGTNQAPDSNKNVNITVPTKTSQLTNDSGFITDGTGATNYVTVDTAQDITAAKTFKNSTDTTKIDGKEIIIRGTDTYNVPGTGDGTNYPNSPSSVTATTETKIDHNTISCNGNSIGYYRNYYPTPNQSSDPAYVSYNDGIEIKTKSYSTTWCNNDKKHEWYSLNISSREHDNGLIFTAHTTYDGTSTPLPTDYTLFSVNDTEIYFGTSARFDQTVALSSATINQDNLHIYTDKSNTYAASETIKDYVKQASLYYNRANSVITATSDTVIEPRSNNAISLGTSTNGFRNIYTCGGSGTNSIIIGYDTSSMTDDAVIIPSVGSNCYVGTTSNHFMGGYIDNIYSNNITVSNEGQLSVYGNTDINGIKLCNNSDQTNYAVVHGDSLWDSSENQESGNLGYANIVLDYYANNRKRASIVNCCEFVEGGSYPQYSMYPVSHTGSSGSFSLGTSDNQFSNIYADSIHGTLYGNASTATSADQDGNGNTISSYYCTLSTEQDISGIKKFRGNLYALGYSDSAGIRFGDDSTSTAYPRIVGETVSSAECALRQHYYVNNTLKSSIQTTCDSTGNLTTITKVGRSGNNTSSVWTLGSETSKLKHLYVDYIGSIAAPVKTMHISGGHASKHIVIDNSGTEPTIAPSITNYCFLGTSTKHWFKAYINNLYIGSNGDSLLTYIANSLSGTNDTNTAIGSIRVIKITVNNKDSDTTIFSAGSNVSGYTIYQGSLANGSFNYQTSALTGTWKLLSELMTPSGISDETYTGSLYAIAIRIA